MITYEQIQAIHEAMRDAEVVFNDRDVDYEDDSDAAKNAFAKIRAALAGELPEPAPRVVPLREAAREMFMGAQIEWPLAQPTDEHMVRPEDVAPPVAERDDEDSKITWQG